MKKNLLVLTLMATIIINSVSLSVNAAVKKPDNIKVDTTYVINTNSNNEGYIDPMVNISSNINSISPMGIEFGSYEYSTYYVKSYKLLEMDAKGPSNEKFIISVARGSNATLSNSVTVTGTLSCSTSLSGGEKDAIAGAFSLNSSASISRTYSKSTVYGFPESYKGKYTTANYYGATYSDKYSVVLVKTDHKSFGGTVRPIRKTEVTRTVYIPKIVSYTRGGNY